MVSRNYCNYRNAIESSKTVYQRFQDFPYISSDIMQSVLVFRAALKRLLFNSGATRCVMKTKNIKLKKHFTSLLNIW